MFGLLFSKNYILITNKDDDHFAINHNEHCLTCCIDRMEEAIGVLCELEDDEILQENAVDVVNKIINDNDNEKDGF
jgi:hypothetical protein